MIRRWQDVPRWLRRTIFVGVNLAAGFSVFVLIVEPVDTLFAENEAEIAAQSETLARVAAVARRKPDVERLARQVDGESELGELLAAANEGAANAALQARLKAFIEAAGARVRSVQGLPSKSDGQISYIGVRIDLYGSLEAVDKAIYAIETGKPYLFVANASIRPSSAAGTPVATAEPVLAAQVDVFGALRMEGPGR